MSTKKKHVLTVLKRFAGIILVAMIIILGLTSSVGAALTDNLDGTITDDDRGDGNSLMWLQESFDVPMLWDEAMTWAETLVFAGYDDWRLPSANDFDSGLPDTGWNSVNNEWGHLYGVEWGNPAGPGDIVPMIGYSCLWYWTSTEDPGDSFQAYAFFVSYDFFWLNDVFPKAEMMCVTAVRDVVVAPLPPVASFTESAHTAPAGTSITFDPISSYDPDGIIVLYEWDFDGDDVYEVSTAISNPVSWLYTAPGTYTVTLRVTDNDGLTDTATDTKNITPPPALATVESCDSTGTKKDSFDVSETVHVIGSGYSLSTTYDIYIVEDVAAWTDGMAIPSRVSGTATTVASDASGNIPPSPVWSPPLTLGKYDIVVDVNGNGLYDEEVDALDDSDIQVTAGFLIIPEVPFGTAMILLSMILASAAFLRFKRFRPKFQPQ